MSLQVTMPEDARLRCETDMGGCGFAFAYLHDRTVLRRLQGGERSTPPNGTVWCHACGTKWEVAPKEVARECNGKLAA